MGAMRLLIAPLLACLLSTAALAAEPLRIGIGPEPETLDPHRGTTIGAARVLQELCEGLLTRDAGGRTAPGMAERWEVSADGISWTFHLREDARWWNGDPVTAHDFVRGWRRAVDPATRSGITDLLDGVANAAEIRQGRMPPDRLGVEALDARTLSVRMDAPAADFDMVLAHRVALPVHGPTLDASGEDFATADNLMCNGPYRLAEHRLHSHYRLVRSPAYHHAASVAVEEVELVVAESADMEMNMFRAGQLDVTSTAPGPMVEWAQAHMPERVRLHPWTALSYLRANPEGAAWRGNPALLEALRLALDRAQLVAESKGRAISADRLVPPGLWRSAPPDSAELTGEARRQAARAALARAGYGGHAKPPGVEILFAGVEPVRRRAIAIAAQWKQVLGVETDLNGIESRMVASRAARGDFAGFVLSSWISYAPSYALSPFLPEGASLPAGSGAEGEAALRALEQEILDQGLVIPLSWGSSMRMVSARVRGWQDNVYDIHPARFLSLAP